jgi:tetratricopeptide (TPR) repeat protein
MLSGEGGSRRADYALFAEICIIAAAMTINSTKQSQNDGLRDLFLSYNRRDSEAVLRVWELLRARSLTTFFDRNDLTPGLPWQAELERAIAQSRAVAVFIGAAGIGAWQRPEKELALDRQVQAERTGQRFPVIPVLLPDAEADKVTGFLTRNTWIDLRGGLDNTEATAALDALARAVTGEVPTTPTPQPEPLCPYRGLEPFHEDDAPLFFGRDQFAEELLQKVKAQSLIAVVGPSGSGKSSVVQAGLLPRLRREGWPNQTWEAVIFTPREQPFHSLARELLPLYEPTKSRTEQMIEARTLAEALAAGTIPLDDPIHAALKASQTANRLLLVVDQFEELFTLSEERYRQPFVEALLAAATRTDSPVTVVLTLRADFYGQAIGLSRALSDGIQQGLVNLGPMTRDELQQAIVKPAESVGLRFEPGLVERLLVDVLGQPGSLPLLEFALKELWLRRRNGMIVNDQYDEIGKLEGAISKRADAQFERVPPAEREAVLRAFTRLVRVSAANEEGTDTRQRVRLKDLDAAVHPVVKSFVKERLLVMSRNEETSEETIEVAHEALIRRWERLKELLNKDRQFFLWRQRLGLMLSEWQRMERDNGALLRGAPLNEAKHWLRDQEKNLNQQEREFIQRSELAARQPRRWLTAIVAVLTVTALAAAVWKLWDDSDLSQVNKILFQSGDLVKVVAADFQASKKAGYWLQALTISKGSLESFAATQKIVDSSLRAKMQLYIVQTLTEARRPSEALELALKIETESIRFQAVVDIVKVLAKLGKVDEALDAARKIDDKNLHALAMSEIIESQAVNGNIEGSWQTAKQILESAKQIETVDARTEVLVKVAESLISTGNKVWIKEVTDKSLEAARKIKQSDVCSEKLISIAEMLIKAGSRDQAEQVTTEALEHAGKIKDVSTHSDAIVKIVELLVRIGKTTTAIEVARGIDGVEAHSLRKAGVYEASSRHRAMGSVAKSLARVGKIEEALEVGDKIEIELIASGRQMILVFAQLQARSEALIEVIKALVKIGSIDKALEVARQIQPPYLSEAMVIVTESLAKVGRINEALEAARKIERADDRSSSLVKIAEIMAEKSLVDSAMRILAEAENVIHLITNDEEKSAQLANLAKGLAKVHSYKQARETADRCTSSSDKLTAYAAILREYHLQHHPEDAKLFAEELEQEN